MRILINTNELQDRLSSYAIVDLRSKQEYEAAHILGAVSLPAGEPQFKTAEGLPTATQWAAALGNCGICMDDTIVAYDDGKSGRAAARFWYIAKHYGHENVLILNGGFGAAAELPLSTSAPDVIPAIYAAEAAEGYFIETIGILSRFGRIKLLDVRSMEEFTGHDLRDNPRGGHIRSAILATMDNFFADAPGQSFATPEKLAAAMQGLGLRTNHNIVTY